MYIRRKQLLVTKIRAKLLSRSAVICELAMYLSHTPKTHTSSFAIHAGYTQNSHMLFNQTLRRGLKGEGGNDCRRYDLISAFCQSADTLFYTRVTNLVSISGRRVYSYTEKGAAYPCLVLLISKISIFFLFFVTL